jgi:hypothetical protein
VSLARFAHSLQLLSSWTERPQKQEALMAKSKSKIGKPRRTAGNLFLGRWKITWMEQWDQAFIDEEVEGFFESRRRGSARFSLGMFEDKSTTDFPPAAESLTWISVGMETMKWIQRKGVVG